MIFVTVGMHEQPFNRLVKYMDDWALEHDEEVIIQTGYCTYKPKAARWKKVFTHHEILNEIQKARIVVSHGGPASFIPSLEEGKIPIVVPRKKSYREHVNNHQVDFCRQIAKEQGNVIVVEDVNMLNDIIDQYYDIVAGMKCEMISNNKKFCAEFETIVNDLVKK